MAAPICNPFFIFIAMEAYGKILVIAMPAFLLLVLFEKWYGWRKGKDTVRNMDMISSLTSGVTNVTKDVLGLALAVVTYGWLVDHIAFTQIKATWLTYVIAFIVLDLAGYLTHALAHKVNFFWNSHIIHHSSEEFNLACALRQSVSVFVRLFVVLLVPAALLGVPAVVIQVVAPLHLFAQFWYHTQHIGKMGILERFMVTPSHHRVHHAINDVYMDRNFGQIFIVWDKLFGTFQEELPEVPAVYGVTRPVRTWNPIKINFQHMLLLFRDAARTKKLSDKLKIFYAPTGWRPADVEQKYPVYKIEDVYNFKKYDTTYSKWFMVYIWAQLLVLLLMVSYLFGHIAAIGSPAIYIYGLFVFFFVYALTETMDGSAYAWLWEMGKCVTGIGILIHYGDWFGSAVSMPFLNFVIPAYLGISVFLTVLLSGNAFIFKGKANLRVEPA